MPPGLLLPLVLLPPLTKSSY